MSNKKSITTFVASFLIFGFLFLALPEKGNSQPLELGCCQAQSDQTGQLVCLDSFGRCRVLPDFTFLGFFEGSTCNEQTGVCSGFQIQRNVPTLSEWGLITMAGVLGVVGFMVMKRKRATA